MDYWTPPMLKWDTPVNKWKKMLSKDPIEDAKYFLAGPFGKGFHVLTNKEDLLVYTPNTNDKRRELTMSSVKTYHVRRNPRPTMPEPGEVLARYLVESRGKLLMVVRFVSSEKATVAFDVFRLDQPQPPSWSWNWKKLTFDTLVDRSIFLKQGCSVSVEMRCPFPLNIYFLDDSARFDGAGTSQTPQIENPFPCRDAGRCCLVDQSIDHCLPREPPSDCSPWVWFFLPESGAMHRSSAMESV
uniref:KIB1-4 beta-propeller domain-containing protein n=1 Tax=Oryza brachyantha TaxID=4533 RepID=J3LC83_ORYBR